MICSLISTGTFLLQSIRLILQLGVSKVVFDNADLSDQQEKVFSGDSLDFLSAVKRGELELLVKAVDGNRRAGQTSNI